MQFNKIHLTFVKDNIYNWFILLIIISFTIYGIFQTMNEDFMFDPKSINNNLTKIVNGQFESKLSGICDSIDVKVYSIYKDSSIIYFKGNFSLKENWLSNDSLYKLILDSSKQILFQITKYQRFAADLNYKYCENGDCILQKVHLENVPK
jgi:hypothetical protein